MALDSFHLEGDVLPSTSQTPQQKEANLSRVFSLLCYTFRSLCRARCHPESCAGQLSIHRGTSACVFCSLTDHIASGWVSERPPELPELQGWVFTHSYPMCNTGERRTIEWFGLEGTLKIIWFHPPRHGQGHLPPAQGAQSSIQPVLEHCQGEGSHSFSGQNRGCIMTHIMSFVRFLQILQLYSKKGKGSREIIFFC